MLLSSAKTAIFMHSFSNVKSQKMNQLGVFFINTPISVFKSSYAIPFDVLFRILIYKNIVKILFCIPSCPNLGFPSNSDGKASACSADRALIPGLGRYSGEGNGNPFQYSCWKISWTEEPGGLQSMGSQSEKWLGKEHKHSCSNLRRIKRGEC